MSCDQNIVVFLKTMGFDRNFLALYSVAHSKKSVDHRVAGDVDIGGDVFLGEVFGGQLSGSEVPFGNS